ncbi:MAG: Nif3-like dinuclear metal center hexameric protein [Actinomycetes bacterium]
MDALWPPSTAESWDAVGLTVGDPDASVRRVMFAVDPVDDVIEEAVDWGADLLVTHHPLLLRPVSSVAAVTPKGRMVTRLLRHGMALYTAHTNADKASPGVSDALAAALGVVETVPLRPDAGSDATGIGRVGRLEGNETLESFAERVASALPVGPGGVRVAGDPRRPVRRVAVSGGAGDDLFSEVRAADVDAFVTADLRHHPASEALAHGGPALLDAGHFATEWPWLPVAAAQIEAEVRTLGDTVGAVETRVSTVCTDPWTALALPSGLPRPSRSTP